MNRRLIPTLALAAAALAAGCQSNDTALNYSNRLGKPEITLDSQRMGLAEFMAGDTECVDCVGGDTNVSVVTKVEKSAFPEFPADGREVACTVTDVSWNYQTVRQSACTPCDRNLRASVGLKVSRPQEGRPSQYVVRIKAGDRVLPRELSTGDTATLRFLSDGTFFDVREWSARYPRVCPVGLSGQS